MSKAREVSGIGVLPTPFPLPVRTGEGILAAAPLSLLQEEAHHDARGVHPYALGVTAAAVPAEPGVSAALDRPEFDDRLAGRVLQCRLIDAPAFDPPFEIDLFQICLAAPSLVEDSHRVDGVDRGVGAAVKDNLAAFGSTDDAQGRLGDRSLHRG